DAFGGAGEEAISAVGPEEAEVSGALVEKHDVRVRARDADLAADRAIGAGVGIEQLGRLADEVLEEERSAGRADRQVAPYRVAGERSAKVHDVLLVRDVEGDRVSALRGFGERESRFGALGEVEIPLGIVCRGGARKRHREVGAAIAG